MTIASIVWVNIDMVITKRCSYLGEKCVKAVHFLALLDEGVVLRNTTKGQLVHQVDLVRLDHVLVLVAENIKHFKTKTLDLYSHHIRLCLASTTH